MNNLKQMLINYILKSKPEDCFLVLLSLLKLVAIIYLAIMLIITIVVSILQLIW